MPKTRSSSTVGSNGSSSRRQSGSGGGIGGSGGTGGSGGGSGAGGMEESIENREMANRLEDRLNEVRTVTVPIESRTRGIMENVAVTFDPSNPGHATVQSESGNSYQVDYENGTCTCRHHIFRDARCRHIEAADLARGQLGEIADGRSAVGQLNNEAVAEGLQARQRADEIEEERRRALSGEVEDDGYFYSDHPEEFETSLSELSTQDLPYDYTNALNGSNITFGVELEFKGAISDDVARELYDLGICAYPEMVPYHSSRHPSVPGKWKLERDGSVTDGRIGGELVSPILQDTGETWTNLEKICEVVKRHGGTVSGDTGAHVHVGMDALDTARQRWKRFFKGIAGNEESIYRFAGGDLGQYRRGYSDFARPFATKAREGIRKVHSLESISDVREMASNVARTGYTLSHNDRYFGMNLTNLAESGIPTVEFRYFNGSLNPAQIQANVKVAAGFINTAEKARSKDSVEFEVSENQKRRGEMLDNANNERSNNEMMKFIDTFFTRKRDKDHVLGVLSKNVWHW